MTTDPRARLFVALDMPDVAAAEAMVQTLGTTVTAYKIGLELLFGGGMGLAQRLAGAGHDVFLDMKLLDIPNTVEKAAANVARLGVGYLTVHGTDRKTLDAAVRGRGKSKLKLLAVTVLTSIDALDLVEQGISATTPAKLVLRRALMAKAAGFDGVIASGHEAADVRAATGPDFLVVTPGIRLTAGPDGDQARVMTPAAAIRAGASHLVVGRPITGAKSPATAAAAIAADIGTLGLIDKSAKATGQYGAPNPKVVDDLGLRASAGLSVFWTSPLGPIRLDFSQVLAKETYDKTESFRFSTSTQF